MKPRPQLSRAAIAFAVAVLGAVSPVVAMAAPAPRGASQTQTPVINSWALTPTGQSASQAGTRAYFSYTLAPSAILKDSVTLWNFGNVQLSFKIYGTDAFNGTDGAFSLLAANRPPKDVGSWVTLTYTDVTLRAHAKVDIPFTLAVPPGVAPGDHAGALLAASPVQGVGADGKVVNLDRRTGSRVYVRIAGPVHQSLVIDSLQTVYHPHLSPLSGTVDVTYTVRNAGNVRVGAHQEVSVGGPLGIASRKHEPRDLPELLPGNAVTLHQHFSGVPALLRAAGDVRLTEFSTAAGAQPTSVRRVGHMWAIPWSVVVVIVLLWSGGRARQAMRRRRAPVASATAPVLREPLTPVS